MHKNKEDPHISFKDLDLLYHLMPSNTLALGPYELSIWKILFDTLQAFAASEKKKEDVYREETTFCNSWEGLESLEYAEKK